MPENEIPKIPVEDLNEELSKSFDHKQSPEFGSSHELNELKKDATGEPKEGEKTEWKPPEGAELVLRTTLDGGVQNVPENPLTEEEKSKALETLMEHGIPIESLHDSYEDMLDESQK